MKRTVAIDNIEITEKPKLPKITKSLNTTSPWNSKGISAERSWTQATSGAGLRQPVAQHHVRGLCHQDQY